MFKSEFLQTSRRSTAPDSARTKGDLAGAPRRSPPRRLGGAVASPSEAPPSLARILRYSRLKAGEILANSKIFQQKLSKIAPKSESPSRRRRWAERGGSEKSDEPAHRVRPTQSVFRFHSAVAKDTSVFYLSRYIWKYSLLFSHLPEVSVGRTSAEDGDSDFGVAA